MVRAARLLGLSVVLAGCGPSVGPGGDSSEIVGPFPIGIEEVPWHVSIEAGSSGHMCSGAIVSDLFVMTAQHCAAGSAADLGVRAGIDRLGDPAGVRVDVEEVIAVPGFSAPAAGKDLALLRLRAPLRLDGRRIAAIPIVGAAEVARGVTEPGSIALVTGWGALSADGPATDDLEALEVPIVSSSEAAAALDSLVTDDQLPAGDVEAEPSPACPDDGGGPLVVADEKGLLLAGLMSWGVGCDRPDAPVVYARVSAFADFIADALAPIEPPPAGALLINEVLADPGPGNDFNGDGVASTTTTSSSSWSTSATVRSTSRARRWPTSSACVA
jgi:secreted trypsin-like serine protease